MGLITRAMAKKLAAINGGSEASGTVAAEIRRTVANGKDSAVNIDTERDVNERSISANDRGAESNEVLNPKIYIESEPIPTRTPPSTDPKPGTVKHGRGTRATRATKPRRVRQATKRKGGSSLEGSTPDASGKISPDHVDAKHNNGTSQDTSIVAAGRKRRREETSEADSHTDRDIVSARPRRRIRRNTRQSTLVEQAPSVARNFRDSTNSSPEAKTNDGLDSPETRYGAVHASDAVPGIVPVCSSYFQGEKENAPVERSASSPPQRSHRKGTCSAREFVGARAILALSKPRVFSKPEHNLEPRKGSNRAHSQTEMSHASPFEPSLSNEGTGTPSFPGDHAEAVEAETAPTWEARELDPDDFAFLVRRVTPYRFEESNMRNEAFTRPVPEE
ncbi:hypothetical protein ACEPAH_9599 [Sanghuangporus vaninii]